MNFRVSERRSESENKKANFFFYGFAVLLFAAFAAQLAYHAARVSTTNDEPPHILAGHRHWQCGDFGINPEHPPLAKLLAAAPLQFRSLVEPDWACGSRITPKPDSFNAGVKFLNDNGMDETVFPARLAVSLLSLFLAAIVFLAAREMFGRREAFAALALLAFEPLLIAHGSLVTTDMALTATAFAAVYAVYRFGKRGGVGNFLLAGAAVGLMLAAKHSAVIFVPVLFALLVADAVFFRDKEKRLAPALARRTAAFGGMFLLGLLVLWSFYGFRYAAVPNTDAAKVSVAEYINQNGRPEMVESATAKLVTAASEWHVLPESYVLGLADIAASGSRNTFIFDRNYATGQWFYFPLAFVVKSSVVLLLLLPFGFAAAFVWREKRREMMFLLAPPLLFFAFALTSKINIGVRHVLPVYAFFIVAAAVGAVFTSRRVSVFKYVLISLLVFHAATTAFRVAPHYLGFSNDFWGGYQNTYRVFPGDSDTEWGQNNRFVAEYLARESITDCWYAPFGRIEMMRPLVQCRFLPSGVTPSRGELIEPVPPIIEGTILLSRTALPPRGTEMFSPIAASEPIAQIGSSVFVYRGRFEVPLAAAFSRAARANQFVARERFDEAIAEARLAIEIAPEFPPGHYSLGLALIAAGQNEEARQALETSLRLMQSNPDLYRNAEIRARRELERLRQ